MCQAFLKPSALVAARKTGQGVRGPIGTEMRLALTTKARTEKETRKAISHKEAVFGRSGPAAAQGQVRVGGDRAYEVQ